MRKVLGLVTVGGILPWFCMATYLGRYYSKILPKSWCWEKRLGAGLVWLARRVIAESGRAPGEVQLGLGGPVVEPWRAAAKLEGTPQAGAARAQG